MKRSNAMNKQQPAYPPLPYPKHPAVRLGLRPGVMAYSPEEVYQYRDACIEFDRAARETKKAEPLSDEQITTIAHRMAWRYKHSSDPAHSDTYTFNRTTLIDFVRAITREQP